MGKLIDFFTWASLPFPDGASVAPFKSPLPSPCIINGGPVGYWCWYIIWTTQQVNALVTELSGPKLTKHLQMYWFTKRKLVHLSDEVCTQGKSSSQFSSCGKPQTPKETSSAPPSAPPAWRQGPEVTLEVHKGSEINITPWGSPCELQDDREPSKL